MKSDLRPEGRAPRKPSPSPPIRTSLLGLPAELRLTICDFVFNGAQIRDQSLNIDQYTAEHLDRIKQSPKELVGTHGLTRSATHLSALLETNRQVRGEATSVLFKHLTLQILHNNPDHRYSTLPRHLLRPRNPHGIYGLMPMLHHEPMTRGLLRNIQYLEYDTIRFPSEGLNLSEIPALKLLTLRTARKFFESAGYPLERAKLEVTTRWRLALGFGLQSHLESGQMERVIDDPERVFAVQVLLQYEYLPGHRPRVEVY